MTSKQLLLSTLRGEERGRMAWAPFLTYWWDYNLVREAEEKGELGFKRSVGCDLLMRGHYDRPAHNQYRDMFTFSAAYESAVLNEKISGGKKIRTYKTPLGDLTAGYTYSGAGDTWFLTEHPVKEERDFRILRYLMQDQRLTPDSDYLQAMSRDPDALFVPLVTPLTKTGFQSMIEYWVGTEEMAYALCDAPEEVEKTLVDMWALSDKSVRLCAASEAEAFLSWEDTSTTNISPAWYEKYILPEINHWCDVLHGAGKLYIQHACGHLRALAPLIAASRIDAIESVSAPPTGNITPLELCGMLPERICVIGGLEPTFLESAQDEEIVRQVSQTISALRGRRFVLANADSCPPGVDINRFGLVARAAYQAFGMTPPAIKIYDPRDVIAPRGVSAYHGSQVSDT